MWRKLGWRWRSWPQTFPTANPHQMERSLPGTKAFGQVRRLRKVEAGLAVFLQRPMRVPILQQWAKDDPPETSHNGVSQGPIWIPHLPSWGIQSPWELQVQIASISSYAVNWAHLLRGLFTAPANCLNEATQTLPGDLCGLSANLQFIFFFIKNSPKRSKVRYFLFSTCLLSQIMAIQSFYTPSALQSKIGTNNDILANNIKFFPPRQHEKLKKMRQICWLFVYQSLHKVRAKVHIIN